MKNAVSINGQIAGFEVVGDQTFTTSLSIAKVFEKRHDNIIAQIKALPQDKFNALNFKVVKYQDQKGEFRPMYKMTRDGFSLLAMGFTGAKAYHWKIEFIEAFNLMERNIRYNTLHVKDKLQDVLEDLSAKSTEADTFKQKYYESLEKQNALLNQRVEDNALWMDELSAKLLSAKDKISSLERKIPHPDEEVILIKQKPKEQRVLNGVGRKFRQEEIETALELYEKGISYSAIGRALGRSASAVSYNIKKRSLV